MRLIDADALSVIMKIPLMKVGKRYMIDYWHVTNMIEKAPTIDAVQVIRCKDCKHRYMAGGYGFCERLDNMFWHHEVQEPISPDFFCQMGERKSE